MYVIDWDSAWTAIRYIGSGLPLTIFISLTSLFFGVCFGVPIGMIRSQGGSVAGRLLAGYVELFRNVPVLVLIVWVYYVLPILTGIKLSPIVAGIVALSLNTSAFLSEVFRGGILNTPRGQNEAASSLGLSYVDTMRFVVLPQVARRMIAPMLNQFIVLIKESALVAFIGVLEIMHRSDLVSNQLARPIEAYTVVALYYFALCFAVSKLARYAERKVTVQE